MRLAGLFAFTAYRSWLGGLLLALLMLPASAQAQTVIGGLPELVQAVQKGDISRAGALIVRGENPNLTNFDGQNGIIIAARNGDIAMIEMLASRGGLVDWQDKLGNTALTWAIQNGDGETAKALLQHGADPNRRNGQGLTPIMAAAGEGLRDVVQSLIAAGADLTITDYTGRSVLDWARDSRTPGIDNLLVQAGAQ